MPKKPKNPMFCDHCRAELMPREGGLIRIDYVECTPPIDIFRRFCSKADCVNAVLYQSRLDIEKGRTMVAESTGERVRDSLGLKNVLPFQPKSDPDSPNCG